MTLTTLLTRDLKTAAEIALSALIITIESSIAFGILYYVTH